MSAHRDTVNDAAELIQNWAAREAFIRAMRRCAHAPGIHPGVAFHANHTRDANERRRNQMVTSALDHLIFRNPDTYASRLARPSAHAARFDFFQMAEGVQLLSDTNADGRAVKDWLQPWITGAPLQEGEARIPKSLSQRVRESRERTAAAGGRRMPSGFLQPSPAAALEYLIEGGATAVGAISEALESLATNRGWRPGPPSE